MIPLRDDNPTSRPAVVTVLLIAVCAAIYFFVQPHDQGVEEATFSYETAAIPCEVVRGRPLVTDELRATLSGDQTACETRPDSPEAFPAKNVLVAVLYSMFLHGSLLHLGGNMLYLWIFGNNVEDYLGYVGYAAFYLVAGLVATGAHIAVQPSSTVPLIGASGAIAGVMGMYLVLYPTARIRSVIIFFFVIFRDVSARVLLGFWFVSQFFVNPQEGVAWVAHVGGFAFGVLAGLLIRAIRQPARRGLAS